MHLALLVPVYNEERTLEQSVRRVLATELPPGVTRRTIVLVDDGSADATPRLIALLKADAGSQLHAICHERNQGKGAAVRTALTAAIELGADLLLIHDADLEYDPVDHEAVLRPILDGRADAVIGSRFLGQTHRVLYYWHRVANLAITQFSNMMTNLNLTDIECCFKAFSRPVLERLKITENRFGVEPELVARLARMRIEDAGRTRPLRIFEVPVSYAGRTYEEGKKIGWRDGVSALRAIVKHNLMG